MLMIMADLGMPKKKPVEEEKHIEEEKPVEEEKHVEDTILPPDYYM